MSKGLSEAWAQSLPDGKSQEHGGLTVQNADGSLQWLAGKEGVQARGNAARYAISSEIEEHWNTIFNCVKGNIRERSEAATRATSAHFHLLYYAGKNGRLGKVDTSTEPPHQECFANATPPHATK